MGLTWEELLVPSTRPRSADPAPEELSDWRSACHFCLERYWWLTRWELEFVATVARYHKPPSAKQLIILHRLIARCRNAARYRRWEFADGRKPAVAASTVRLQRSST